MKSTPRRNRIGENLLLALIGVPVLGVLMGGVYSLPAMKLTNERDPWLTLLLAGGLGVTVFSMGLLLDATPISLAFVWALGIVLLLLARRAYGSLGHSLERFGLVHAAILVVTLVVAVSVRSHVGE